MTRGVSLSRFLITYAVMVLTSAWCSASITALLGYRDREIRDLSAVCILRLQRVENGQLGRSLVARCLPGNRPQTSGSEWQGPYLVKFHFRPPYVRVVSEIACDSGGSGTLEKRSHWFEERKSYALWSLQQ